MNSIGIIIGRELRVASRRPATWRLRLVVASLAVAGSLFLLVTSDVTRTGPGGIGMQLFAELTAASGISALALGVFLTADSISRERREGTLGLLFLTDLSGWDVVLGKAGAAVFNAAYALMSIVPVLAIGLLLGGVTLGQVAMLAIALLNALFLSLAVAIWISTWCTAARQSAGLATSLVFGLTALPWGAMIWIADRSQSGPGFLGIAAVTSSPGLPLSLIASNGNFPNPGLPGPALFINAVGLFTIAILVQQALAWGFLWRAARRTRTIWQEGPSRRITQRIRAVSALVRLGGSERRLRLRNLLLDRHPFLWLSQREIWKPLHPWILLTAFAGLFAWQWFTVNLPWRMEELATPLIIVTQILVGIWFATEAATRLVEERQGGSFELLLCTPLDGTAILSGQRQALNRMFVGPLAVLIALDLWAVVGTNGAGLASITSTSVGALPTFVIGFLFALPATRWVATLQALQGHSINAVGVRTLALVWGVPAALAHLLRIGCQIVRGVFAIPGLLPLEEWGSLLVFLAAVWMVGYRARRTVFANFRELATETQSKRRRKSFWNRNG